MATNYKKILALLMAFALVFALAACGGKDKGGDETAFAPAEDVSDTYEAESNGSGLSEALEWWNGDFYGYWTVTAGYGALEYLEDGVWDCYAVIEIEPDGAGIVYIWDDEDEMGTVEIKIDESGGIAPMGSATSEGGVFFDMPVKHADWVMMPTYEGYEDYYGDAWPGDYMEFDAYYEDEAGNSVSYRIVLRPWGILWEDIPDGDRPPYYETWYKNAGYYEYATLLEALEHTNSITDGIPSYIHSAFSGGAPSGGRGEQADSGADNGQGASGGGAVVLNLTNAELGAIWNKFQEEVWEKEATWQNIKYEDVVKLLGAEGEKTEDRDGFVEYRWYASDDGSLSIRWNSENGEWLNSALNQYGRP